MGEGLGTGRTGTAQLGRGRLLFIALLVLSLALPAAAFAAFPGTNPNESVRINTPNDPGFDPAEPDGAPQTSTNIFDNQYARFGFAPNASQLTALYNPAALPARQSAQNLLAGRNPLAQVAGVSADRAWKYFGEDNPSKPVGDPNVEIGIMDTGIRWGRSSLRLRVSLNEDELPPPQIAGGNPCPNGDDCNNDGAFNVDDFANDPRVSITAGNNEADGILDASDLLVAFSDGTDADGNGYVDDIAGWDFFDDDNDPFDASSYSAASNHGSGRAEDAAAEGNDGQGGIGVCPGCQVVPLRVWDTFVADTNNVGQATMYAADNDIEIVEAAIGGLLNSSFVRETFAYAYAQGTLPVVVSSDLNTANHNYPTNYNESLHVQGTVADVNGLGMNPPQEFIDFFNQLPAPLPIGTNLPVSTWFRNSGTTQYGGHAHIVMPATTGSEATGQASGAAGLLISYANRKGITLDPNEVKQLLTETAEDVDPRNTNGLGVPDPAQVGWDQHFGYGRPDLGLAIERIRNQAQGVNGAQQIPPEALITSPDWFAPLNVADQSTVEVRAALSASRSADFDWELQWAPGIEPCESEFQTIDTGNSTTAIDGALGDVDLDAVRAALDARTGVRAAVAGCQNSTGAVTGGSTVDPTAPVKGPGDVDPNEPAFTVRVQVTDADGTVGEDRKVLFAYEDETLHEGWSRPIGGAKSDTGRAGTGGESSHRMYDVDGDNQLEIVESTSSGRLHVLEADGTPTPSFNGGNPVLTQPLFNVHPGAPGLATVAPPREALRIPAIGDIDGDREPEIVNSAGLHVYAWEMDGTPVQGFPVSVDRDLSAVPDRTYVNHIKPGFLASPALGDLDGDGDKEIAIAALDQHLYVWRGDGSQMPNFPVYLRPRDTNGDPIPCSAAFECAESINTPAIGDIDGDDVVDIVVSTNEFDDNPAAPGPPASLGGLSGLLTNFLAQALGGSNRTYAVDSDGEFLAGWPTTGTGLLPDVLPFVGPGVDQVMGNIDSDPELEVIGGTATGDLTATDGDGSTAVEYDSQPSSGDIVDKTKQINLFENPVVANLDGTGGLEVMKGGVSLLQVVNLGVLTGGNLPYNHSLQAWNAGGATGGTALPAYPQAVEDYQLLGSPTVADVSDAPGNEAIVGTGMYLIRNLNSTGVEGTDWPKFTGGWNFAVPSVGDVDGDGKLEVAAQTREGFSFLWDTDGDACAAGADEWRTSRHDEFNSGAYGTDSRPPAAVRGLAATAAAANGAELSWNAPGDDWLCGEAESYRVLLSTDPIVHPADADVELPFPAGGPVDTDESQSLTAAQIGNTEFAAVIYRDEAGNWGRVRSVQLPPGSGTPNPPVDPGNPNPPGGDPYAPDDPDGGACSERAKGTNSADRLSGTDAGDRIAGRGGNDRIAGGPGDDCLTGNGGDDKIKGDDGKDVVKGGNGNDRIKGGAGKDRINGGAGVDRISARDGERDKVKCGDGNDIVVADRKDKVSRKDCEKVRRR